VFLLYYCIINVTCILFYLSYLYRWSLLELHIDIEFSDIWTKYKKARRTVMERCAPLYRRACDIAITIMSNFMKTKASPKHREILRGKFHRDNRNNDSILREYEIIDRVGLDRRWEITRVAADWLTDAPRKEGCDFAKAITADIRIVSHQWLCWRPKRRYFIPLLYTSADPPISPSREIYIMLYVFHVRTRIPAYRE